MTAKGVRHDVKCPECGIMFKVAASRIRNGRGKFCSRKCGAAFNGRKHGHTNKTASSATYTSWAAMKGRCGNPKNPKYYMYGGAGVQVCEQWMDFESFLRDMGERPAGTSLDRIDGTGDYTPENCRWATPKMQSSNTRQNVWYTVDGERFTNAQLARRAGVSPRTMSWRTRNWPVSRWLEPPHS
jgi:hypothetical protein